MFTSVRKRVMFFFVLLTVLPLLAVAFLTYQSNRTITGIQQQINTAEQLSDVISSLRSLDIALNKYVYTEDKRYLIDFQISLQNLQSQAAHLTPNSAADDTQSLALRNANAVLTQFFTRYNTAFGMAESLVGDPLQVERLQDLVTYTLDSVINTNSRSTAKASIEELVRIEQQRTLMLLCIVPVFFIAVVMAIFLARYITRPIVELSERMQQFSRGNFDVEPVHIRTHDEIHDIGEAFNGMVVSIKNYIVRIEAMSEQEKRAMESENALKTAQLKALQAQINPHFLYNTLNAGAQLAILEEADETGRFLVSLSKLFRYNLSNMDTVTTLREELAHVDLYFEILNIRYSGTIEYEKDIDPQCLDFVMPRMILQPLAENSFLHGLSVTERPGRIQIRARRGGDMIDISIFDNGVGMTKEMLLAVRSRTYAPANQSTGLGLANIISRLRLFYCRDDVISLDSEENAFTMVTLRLPTTTVQNVREETNV